MAVIKAKSSKSPVAGVINYILKKEKTEWKISSGMNCNPLTAKEEMQMTKELWNKTGGRTYFHFIQSFAPGEEVDPETAHALAGKFVEQLELFKGFEVVYATHKDRKHIHTHFVVNSVSVEDGHKLRMRKKDLQTMKDFSDSLCREFGLSITVKGKSFQGTEREDTTAYEKDTYQLLLKAEKKQAESYVTNIALAVMNAREEAVSREDFISRMGNLGYKVNWTDSHKYIVFEDEERKKKGEKKYKIRNKKLEEYFHIGFGKEQLENEFKNNVRRRERNPEKRFETSAFARSEDSFGVTGRVAGADVLPGQTNLREYPSEGSLGKIGRQLREVDEGVERRNSDTTPTVRRPENDDQRSESIKSGSRAQHRWTPPII